MASTEEPADDELIAEDVLKGVVEGYEGTDPDAPEEPEEGGEPDEDEPEGDTPEDSDDSEDDAEPAEPAVDPAALDEAISALRRDGLTPKVIDRLTEEEVLALGGKAAKRQANVDEAYRERDRLRSRAKDPAEAPDDPPATAEPTGTTSSAFESAVAPLVSELGLEESTAQGVSKAFALAVEREVRPVRELAERLEAAMAEQVFEGARSELAASAPEIAEESVWQEVRSSVEQLWGTGRHADLDPPARLRVLMRDSLRLIRDEPQPADGASSETLARARRNGRPMRPVTKTKAKLPDDPDERLALKALDIANGMTIDQIRRKYGP